MKKRGAKRVRKPSPDLIPADPKRCQAEVPNGHSFMTLGGRPGGRVRCDNIPSVIVVEQVPGADGKCGSMSLCASCLAVFRRQMPNAKVEVKELAASQPA